MKTPQGGKRFVALSAAVTIGLGGVALTVPAMAANDGPKALGEAVSAVAAADENILDKVAAIGYDAEGDVVVQTVAGANVKADDEILKPIAQFAQATNGQDEVEVVEIANGYSPVNATDVVGGAGYAVAPDGGAAQDIEGLCSFGFPATGPNGEEAILTAGHCAEEGASVFLEKPSTSNAGTGQYHDDLALELLKTESIGTFTASEFGETILDPNDPDYADPDKYSPEATQDFAVITLDDDTITTHPEVTDWTTAGDDDLSASTTSVAGVHDVEQEDIGQTITRSGRTSAQQEGPIGGDESGTIGGIVDGYGLVGMPDSPDPENPEIGLVYGFAAEALGIPGDSGGAVMMGDQAVGVTSLSNYDPATQEGDWIWVAELAKGLETVADGYEVKTVDEEPEPTDEPTETGEPTEEPTETGEPTEEPTETTEPTQTGEPTETADPTPTATETEDPELDPALAVDPQEIAAERFIAEDEDQAIEDDRGVAYTVTDVEPGSEVTFDTYVAGGDDANAGSGAAAPAADSDDEPAKSITVTADENGTASSRVWGLPTADASAYIGDYEVVATTEDETLEGSFSVVEGSGDGDGGQDDGDNGDGDDLPRTGSTTAPLVAGAAGLVALGGALVYVARRRQA